jgi:hypothetical protein
MDLTRRCVKSRDDRARVRVTEEMLEGDVKCLGLRWLEASAFAVVLQYYSTSKKGAGDGV